MHVCEVVRFQIAHSQHALSLGYDQGLQEKSAQESREQRNRAKVQAPQQRAQEYKDASDVRSMSSTLRA